MLLYLSDNLLRVVRMRPLASIAVNGDRYSVGYSQRHPQVPGLSTVSSAAESVHHNSAQTCDHDDDPDREHRGDNSLAAMYGDYGHETGYPGADSDPRPRRLDPARSLKLCRGMGIWRVSAHFCVYSLVDFRANPIDQAFCDRAVIVAAKFMMCCCCGSDLVPRRLIHGVTIHLKYW
jgi:hypothetical protein